MRYVVTFQCEEHAFLHRECESIGEMNAHIQSVSDEANIPVFIVSEPGKKIYSDHDVSDDEIFEVVIYDASAEYCPTWVELLGENVESYTTSKSWKP